MQILELIREILLRRVSSLDDSDWESVDDKIKDVLLLIAVQRLHYHRQTMYPSQPSDRDLTWLCTTTSRRYLSIMNISSVDAIGWGESFSWR
jgi:transposase InsO family protein